jgi:hypothetical protein
MRRRVVTSTTLVAVLVAAGLYWFQPWKLFTSTTITEAVPVVGAATPYPATADPSPASGSTPFTIPVLVAQGDLVAHEHATSGRVQLVRLPDGRHQLILRDLSTSDGPDLRVWLTDQPVVANSAGWHVFDDGRHLEVGRLKGNRGTQLYDVPVGTDVIAFRSVTIWCQRFAVSFGAAELMAP